jgi:hypothetical protein
LETEAETLIATQTPPVGDDGGNRLAQIRCPVLVLHGSDDMRIPLEIGQAVHAALPSSQMVIFEGSGHVPQVRDPVRTNLLLREFLAPELPPRPVVSWTRAQSRRTKRALFVSSPIGLGHAQRDVAIARELRALVPGRGQRRAHPPAQRRASRRIGAHRSAYDWRAYPARLPSLARHG